MKERRLKKIKDFEFFYDNCKSIFTQLRDSDNRAKIFENEYMLCICPGSRAGGNEKRIVEVFWGARPYEFETKGNQWKSLTETGATLFFYRNDTGDITISLYPAKTEVRKPIEDYIALYKWLNPQKLNNPQFISSLWNDFIAYMECTSLDGKPTFLQKTRISYLKTFNHLVIESRWTPTKFSVFYKEVLKWIFVVVVSGIVVNVSSTLMTETNEPEIQLKEINKNLNTISKQLGKDSANKNEIKIMSLKLDTLEVKITQILKKKDNHNQHTQKPTK